MNEPRLQPQQVQALRSVLASAVEHDGARRRRPAIVRRVAFGSLAVGALAATIAAVTLIAPTADSADVSASASVMLREAAKVTVDPDVPDGQFLKLATTASYLALATEGGRVETSIGYVESQLREVFISADGSDHPVEQTTYVAPTVFFGAGAEEFAANERKRLADAPAVTPALAATLPDATRPVEDQSAMPRQPEALLAYLTEFRYQAGSSDENVFAHVVDLLRSGTVKSDLRAALYTALALMPAVVVTEHQVTLDGRHGTAIGLQAASATTRQEIVIDPTTGEFIGVRLVTITGFGEIPAGTALEYTAFSSTVVNTVPR